MTDSSDKNRAYWNSASRSYQELHGDVLERTARAWGVWRIPESQLDILGDTRNLDVLEYGCGAAQWAVELRRSGSRAVGLDFSHAQLRQAVERAARRGVPLPLVQGDARALPFPEATFDIVFCDHGAMTFAPPEPAVAEVARVLRPGGRFAFCMSTPLRDLCCDEASETPRDALVREYFGMRELVDAETVGYQLPYGDWIRLFRGNGLVVEDLVELRPSVDAVTTYEGYVSLEWARRWPAEHIWKLRKAGPSG